MKIGGVLTALLWVIITHPALAHVAVAQTEAAPVAGAPPAEAAPSTDAQNATPDAQANTAPPISGQRRICRREVRTGSITVRRVCRTVAEVQLGDAESRERLRRLQESERRNPRREAGTPPGPS